MNVHMTRAEAVMFINRLLNIGVRDSEIIPPDHKIYDDLLGLERKIAGQKRAWHFGRCELRALLDVIYGAPPDPTNIEELIQSK